MSARLLAGALAATTVLASSVASAQAAPQFYTARALSFAGARSMASSVEATFLNPAALGWTEQYLLQVDYAHDTAPSKTLAAGNGIAVSILDSKTNPRFPTGISYRYVNIVTNGVTQQGSVYDFALGAMLFQQLLVGLHVSYLSYSNGGKSIQTATGDIGVFAPIGPIQFSAVGFNLIDVQTADAPRGFDTGVSVGDHKVYRFGFDFSRLWPYKAPPTNTYTLGGEITIASIFSFRAGLLWNQFKVKPEVPQFVTGGVGFFFKFIGADATYRRNLQTSEGVWEFAIKIATG